MLKTLNVLHTPDLLHALASMGHGDEIALVDCRFPAVSVARAPSPASRRCEPSQPARRMPASDAAGHVCARSRAAHDAGSRSG